jgi:hypothetical protein
MEKPNLLRSAACADVDIMDSISIPDVLKSGQPAALL